MAYAAPELLLGKLPTTKCDVYSLGILLWQMRYREYPYFEIDSMETIIYKVSRNSWPSHCICQTSTKQVEQCIGITYSQVIKFNYRPDARYGIIYDEYSTIYMKCWELNPEVRPDVRYVIKKLQTAI